MTVLVNGQHFEFEPNQVALGKTASGFDPRLSSWLSIPRLWKPGDTIQLDFEMPVRLRRASTPDKAHRGKVAVTRGPLVFCLESVDNKAVNIFNCQLEQESLTTQFSPNLLGGTQIITAQSREGERLTFIPYHLWANRGESLMTVWVNGGNEI